MYSNILRPTKWKQFTQSSVIRESLLTNTRNKWQPEKFSENLNKSQINAIKKILISVLLKLKKNIESLLSKSYSNK